MKYLYKYKSLTKETLTIFTNRSLYFTNPSKFNDPFDGQLSPREFASELRSIGIEPTSNRIELGSNHVSTILHNSGVYCLSKKPDDLLMWSHYADSHTGICIGFKEDIEKYLSIDLAKLNRIEVSYDQKHPFYEIHQELLFTNKYETDDPFEDHFRLAEDLLIASLSKKHESWKYEKEVRLILSENGLIRFQPEAIDHVIIGLRTPKQDIETLKAILSIDAWKHVRLKRAIRTSCSLELTIENENEPNKAVDATAANAAVASL